MAGKGKSMPRRGKRVAETEPPIIAQANPTPEQRVRSQFVVGETVDPYGETVVQGKVQPHKVCRRQPVYVTLYGRKGICDRAKGVLDWYDNRYALASKGLFVDSLARPDVRGSGNGYGPTEAGAVARSDCDWAKSFLGAGLIEVFVDIMERERTFAEIGRGNNRKEHAARTSFKVAANWLLLQIGDKVLPC